MQACAWLGHWYAEVAQDLGKAKNCYEQTLLMDPSDAVIANRLKQARPSSWPCLRRIPHSHSIKERTFSRRMC